MKHSLVWLCALCLLSLGWYPAACATPPQSNLTISVYQGECSEGDFAANLRTARKVAAQAQTRGSQFVAFPECFLSGYGSAAAVQQGARGLEDPELQAFIAESTAHDMVLLVGLARRTGSNLFNSELVIQHGKLLGVYDKVMLTTTDRDALGFTPGSSLPVFRAHGTTFAVIIGHDSSFPELASAARLQGARVLFSPHNTQVSTTAAEDHRRWVRNCHVGLACQFRMVVAHANAFKREEAGSVGYGDSFILSPQGSPLAEAKLLERELISATLEPELFAAPTVWGDLSETPAWLRSQLGQQLNDFRRPANDQELQYWLDNMLVQHRFSREEVSLATGLTPHEIASALQRFESLARVKPPRAAGESLQVLPYPGGRHPRIGFFEGAVMPQRETKISVFTPWDDASYVVADIPEAIFSNLGLTYLAHTHIPTIWDEQGIRLPRLEWERRADGSLSMQRELPNGIAFGTQVVPSPTEVKMELWLRNGTQEKLTGLRVQNCVMLAAAEGFDAQTEDNKLFQPPYAATRSESGAANRWIITAWDPVQRCWGNARCPCMHSDPQFPDCQPGETVRLRGWLSFYEGADIEAELQRIEQTGWRN